MSKPQGAESHVCGLQAAEHAAVHSLPALCQLLLLDGSSRSREARAASLEKTLAAALATPVKLRTCQNSMIVRAHASEMTYSAMVLKNYLTSTPFFVPSNSMLPAGVSCCLRAPVLSRIEAVQEARTGVCQGHCYSRDTDAAYYQLAFQGS